MDTGKIHHYWVKYRSITLFVPIILFIIFSSLSLWQLRQNNLKMLQLKDAVIKADEQGADVETALQNLRMFVNSHMNTRMRASGSSEPPIQLVNRYNQLVAMEQAKIANINDSSSELFQKAQVECNKPDINLSLRNQCIKDYYISNGGGGSYIQLPAKELYTYDFASPRWSFDLAGISIIISGLLALFIIIRLILGVYIKKQI